MAGMTPELREARPEQVESLWVSNFDCKLSLKVNLMDSLGTASRPAGLHRTTHSVYPRLKVAGPRKGARRDDPPYRWRHPILDIVRARFSEPIMRLRNVQSEEGPCQVSWRRSS
jgi:hypothetical protein